MPDGTHACTEQTLVDLAEVVAVPEDALPHRLSELLASFVGHDAILTFAADIAGGQRRGAGDRRFVEGVPYLLLDERRRMLRPGTLENDAVEVYGERVPILQLMSRNGALLLIARPRPVAGGAQTVLQLWNIVALRVQDLADAALPGFLQLARFSSGERMEALTELADEYSTTLESMLAALRSTTLNDRGARQAATALAAEGLVHLRTASDRVRTVSEEPVTTAFERLRDDLRPILRYRDLDVQFVEPPANGRPLPSEVAHGARAVVRGSILALIDRPEVGRVRVQWDCDGTNLLIDMRDNGPGDLSQASTQLRLVRQRVHALNGRMSIEATPEWGTEMAIVIPLDPPHPPLRVGARTLRPRELEVLRRISAGRRNRAIADELGISENTVKFHVARIFRALGVNTRAEATAVFLDAQLPMVE